VVPRYYTLPCDAVGNRLSLTTGEGVVNYEYDAANRLTSVNGQAYTWDANGNPSTGSGQACSMTACAPTPTTTPTA
jgi:YD repeat-containing protein